jgi:hypothetical protein
MRLTVAAAPCAAGVLVVIALALLPGSRARSRANAHVEAIAISFAGCPGAPYFGHLARAVALGRRMRRAVARAQADATARGTGAPAAPEAIAAHAVARDDWQVSAIPSHRPLLSNEAAASSRLREHRETPRLERPRQPRVTLLNSRFARTRRSGCGRPRRSRYEIARTAVAPRRDHTPPAHRHHHRGPSPPGRVRPAPDQRDARVPDAATFLSRMLTSAVPSAWQPEATRTALRRLRRLHGTARDAAAADLAVGLAAHDAPVAALGHPAIGELFSARLSCRISPRFGVDLAALCLR